MKYAFIRDHSRHYPVRTMCKVLGVSASGYYGWRTRRPCQREESDQVLVRELYRLDRENYQTYGAPRLHMELCAEGHACGRKRVARLKKQAGLITRQQQVWQRSVKGKTWEHVSGNILNRDFYANKPNQRWVADITHIATREGWLYLSVILDLYSRAVVGWAMDARPAQTLTTDALAMAVSRRHVKPGLLLHSDQGMHYKTREYHAMLKMHSITPSMSRKGNCHDNAVAESFFHSLKTEWVRHAQYRTRDEARKSLFEYMEMFYNRRRRHSYLQYLSPFEFERINNP